MWTAANEVEKFVVEGDELGVGNLIQFFLEMFIRYTNIKEWLICCKGIQ